MKIDRVLSTSIFCLTILFFLSSCENKRVESVDLVQKPPHHFITYPTDTVNFTDQNKLKQGIWYTFDKNHRILDTIVYSNDTAYSVSPATIKDVIDKLNNRR